MAGKITYERTVTIDDVVNEANNIWAEWRKARLRNADQAQLEEYLVRVQTEHREFATAYPIVCKWLCVLGQYNPKVFRQWLQKIQENMWKSTDEYLDAQADYLTRLFRSYNPRTHYKVVGEYRESMRKALGDEWSAFQKTVEDAKGNAEEIDAQLKAVNRAELADYFAAVGEDAVRLGGTVRVESDEPVGGSAPAEVRGNSAPLELASTEYRPTGCAYSAVDLLAYR